MIVTFVSGKKKSFDVCDNFIKMWIHGPIQATYKGYIVWMLKMICLNLAFKALNRN